MTILPSSSPSPSESLNTHSGSLDDPILTACANLPIIPPERKRSIPTASSEALVLNPRICLNHPGSAAPAHALMTEELPNVVIEPQTMPAEPLFPTARSPAALDPMRVVNAPISTRPFPTFIRPTTWKTITLCGKPSSRRQAGSGSWIVRKGQERGKSGKDALMHELRY